MTNSNRQALVITGEICIQRRKGNYAPLEKKRGGEWGRKSPNIIYESKTKGAIVQMSLASSQNIWFSFSPQALKVSEYHFFPLFFLNKIILYFFYLGKRKIKNKKISLSTNPAPHSTHESEENLTSHLKIPEFRKHSITELLKAWSSPTEPYSAVQI